MKTGVLTTKTIASEGMASSVMGMSVKGMDIASYFLRDRIYTDKKLAVIRELISNADDEHTKHKIQKNVEVAVYLEDSKWHWKVRDYALGLSDHDIRNVFGMYFESTKGHDNESIGGFGVGSKSPLCYTDSFIIISHHKGLKTTYCSSLGAGKNGIPVGEIFEISKEPTTEQGIEISLDINIDHVSFIEKTAKFVEGLRPNTKIVFDNRYSKTTVIPIIPLRTIQRGGYTINGYDISYRVDGMYGKGICIRMGGIIYEYNFSCPGIAQLQSTIVVDVPIGKLTIPISRESIETTPANEKIFEEIRTLLLKLAEEDKSGIKVPKYGEYISGNTSPTDHTGDWFDYTFRNCFPDTVTFKSHMVRPYGKVFAKPVNNGKYIIYVFPNIKNNNNWHKRLENSLTLIEGEEYGGYMHIRVDHLERYNTGDTLDTSDCAFVDVKKLKLPKLLTGDGGPQTSFIAYRDCGYREDFTIEEMEQYTIAKYFGDIEQDDDWYKDASMNLLNARTVAYVKEYGTRSNFWNVSSKKLLEGLVELGWLTPDSKEYKARRDEIIKLRDAKAASANAEYNAKRVFFQIGHNPRIIEAIKKVPSRLNRILELKNRLIKESSPRGRILASLDESYGKSITRADFKVILKLT
tara:strand:+ start:10212 stop:12113 length:1902 start_codon:yes stop_codon:yes gene_type:complete